MTNRSINESYNKLLEAFKESGVKLTKNQKSGIDTFMLALESKIKDTRDTAIKATKDVVSKELDKEYQAVFESLFRNINRYNRINSKIMALKGAKYFAESTANKNMNKVVESLDAYLEKNIEKALPKKVVIDYDRINKLEKVIESLKTQLGFSDESVQLHENKLKEKFKSILRAKNAEIMKLKTESNKIKEKAKKALVLVDEAKADKYLQKKIKDLPVAEANIIREKLEGKSVSEIDNNFDTVKSEAEETVKEQQAENALELEAAITKIVTDSEDNDKKSVINKESCDNVTEDDVQAKIDAEIDKIENGEEVSKETKEEIDDEVLPESNQIDCNQMKLWISRSNSIAPIA